MAWAYFIAGIVAIITIILGVWIGLQAMSREEKDSQKYGLIRQLMLPIALRGTTKFKGANLTDADFSQAILYYTDFTNAITTGTVWKQAKGLNFSTRETIKTDKTLDLTLKDSINPDIAATAVEQLSKQYPQAQLELLAIEGQSEQELRFHAKVAEGEHSAQLAQQLNQIYRQLELTSMVPREPDNPVIQNLSEAIKQIIKNPNRYLTINYIENQGEIIMSQEQAGISKGNVNISNTQGNISGVAVAGENQSFTGVALGEISGTVTNTINQLPASAEPEQPGVKELLTQLQAAIESDENLSDDDKKEILEQVNQIAQAGQKPQDSAMQKLAKTAIDLLKLKLFDLPSAEKLLGICRHILPQIAAFFGF